jgi:hypothetical protein
MKNRNINFDTISGQEQIQPQPDNELSITNLSNTIKPQAESVNGEQDNQNEAAKEAERKTEMERRRAAILKLREDHQTKEKPKNVDLTPDQRMV